MTQKPQVEQDKPKDEPPAPDPTPWDPSPADVPDGAVVFHRTGGVAGFADRLVVERDGTATLTSRSDPEPVTCTVDPELMAKIREALDKLDKGDIEPRLDPGAKPTSYPDKIETFVTYNDVRVQYGKLAKAETEWRGLFSSLSQVLGAASALRDGTAAPDGTPACSA